MRSRDDDLVAAEALLEWLTGDRGAAYLSEVGGHATTCGDMGVLAAARAALELGMTSHERVPRFFHPETGAEHVLSVGWVVEGWLLLVVLPMSEHAHKRIAQTRTEVEDLLRPWRHALGVTPSEGIPIRPTTGVIPVPGRQRRQPA